MQGVKNSLEVFASCTFSSLGLHPTLCEQLKERLGFEVPTQVQAQAVPVALSGRHVLVNAATGKTVSYLAPIIHMLQEYDQQIKRSDGTFGITILVATPGRLLDHLKNTSCFVYTNLRWIIFDEADRILELGFGKDIEEILTCLGTRKPNSVGKGNASVGPKVQRQNLMLSATLNEKVNHLAQISLENPVMIGLGDKMSQNINHIHFSLEPGGLSIVAESGKMLSSNREYNVPSQLVQRYIEVPCGSRLVVFLSILKNLFEKKTSQKVVVFFSTCVAVDFHYSLLSEFQWNSKLQSEAEIGQIFMSCMTLRLHGSMNSNDRKTTIRMFKTAKSALLLSTDVSARGLDIPKVRCIIQYDSPSEATEYVHRIGRTARLGEKGDSILFLQPVEIDYLKDLEKHGMKLTKYPIRKLLSSFPMHNLKQHQVKKFVSLERHPWLLSLQRALESFVSTNSKIKNMANHAFDSWSCAYMSHRGELKQIFTANKLHWGHVAKSFALKDEPSEVQKQINKRKRNDDKVKTNKRRVIRKS